MDKPLCRLCNHKHYSHEDHVLPDIQEEVSLDAPKNFSKKIPVKKTKEKFDRVAYQREYMRKRRARK